ncbi:hypothetical protein FB567DRAFT_613153 [Paraphoma chrysanthemicola]|uniref:AB hydrolase-1 domain-containing protein n=1 Tax=Paraphoma chrysanthemicola TaxID=798071 RepID=A0A8K0VSE2_9PLEO|nr:hypothetical protein FB567DRAFT_613153 [Paraphoma chrysanthemicola]
MWHRHGAAALTLLSVATLVTAQECPPGFAKNPAKVTWVNCPTKFNADLECSTLEVPADWTNPSSGEKIKLRLVRQPADNPNAKSIIVNPGGPGESGIKTVVDGGTGYQAVVGTGFHIIGFDPRGVGLTTPYLCREAEEDSGLYNSSAGLQAAFNYNIAQGKKCADAKLKSDLIGTAFVARDIKAIAEALGEDNLIRYWGFSYGTLLGATLAAMFPEKMDRVILDGNINPTDYYRGLGQEGSTDLDRGVRRFFDQCAEAGPDFCAVAVAGQTGAALLKTFDDFLASTTYLPGRNLRQEFQDALYFKNATHWTLFAKRLNHYYTDASALGKRSLSKRQSGLDWKPDYAPIDTDLAITGITCGDVITRYAGSPENFNKYGGDIAINLLFAGQFSGIKTLNPILFLNSQYDPVTPLVSAQNSALGFVGAKVFVSSGVGHCTSANESPELNAVMKTYMIEGKFPATNTVYTPKVKNVFKTNAKRTLNGPSLSRRDVEYPSYFENEAQVVKRAESTPVGCTPIAASSTPVASASSSAHLSVAQVSSTPAASSSASVHVSSSSVAHASTSSAAHVSSSSVDHASSSSIDHVSSSSIAQASSSADHVSSSSIAHVSSSSAEHISSSLITTPSASSHADLSSSVDHGSASSSAAVHISSDAASSSHVQSSGKDVYDQYSGSPSSVGGYNDYPPSRSTGQVYDQYYDSYPTTSTPCPTPAWSSQPGYIPYTKTYTTTTVQTITECRRNDKACPLNTATRTAYITETKTATTVIAIPTTTVYVTKVVDVCSTGLTTKTATVTQTCNSGCTTRVTGVPQGYTTTVKYCDACATPSTVTVTYCTACVNQPSATPIKGTPVSVPSKPSTIPSKPSSVVKPSSPTSIQGYGPPPSSKPVVDTPSVPSKPSNPPVYDTPVVKTTPTTNAASTPSKPTTLQSNVASTGVYFCTGTNCVATPTRSQPAQFTGSASRAGSSQPLHVGHGGTQDTRNTRRNNAEVFYAG